MRIAASVSVVLALLISQSTGRAFDVTQQAFAAVPVSSTITLALPAPVANQWHTLGDAVSGLNNARNYGFGDLNGDGLADLVLKPTYLNYEPRMQPRFLVNIGGGRFEEQTAALVDGELPSVGVAVSMFVNDFNGDGRADVFFVDSGLEDKAPSNPGFDGARNTVMLSQPGGRIKNTSPTSLPINDIGFNHVSSVADIDGNGALDVFIQRLGGPKMAGNGALFAFNDGSGKFIETTRGLPATIAYLTSAQSLATSDRQAAGSTGACDLDGDRRVDVMTGSYTNLSYPRNVRVFQQSAASEFAEKFRIAVPDGILQTAATIPGNTSVGAAGFSCADLNADGRPDIGVYFETPGGAFILLLRNDGGFRFTDVTVDWFGSYDLRFPVRGGTSAPGGFTFRDLNGDGAMDFAPLIQTTWTPDMLWAGGFAKLNDGTGRLEPMRYRPDASTGTVADLSRVLGCFVAQCPFAPLLFDATGDGIVDLLLVDTQTNRTRDLPAREDKIIIYTFAGKSR